MIIALVVLTVVLILLLVASRIAGRRVEREVADSHPIRLASLYDKMEQRAQRSEALYQSIVDTALDSIIVIDEIGTVHAYNRAAEHMFGYAADEVLGHNVSMLMAEPYGSNHDRYLKTYRETGVRKIIGIGREVHGKTRQGAIIAVDLMVTEWMSGNERRFTGILRD